MADYRLLAERYVESFEQKWIAEESTPSEELLGSGDIQSLADLGNGFVVVREMRVVPFGLQDIARLATTTAAPMVPLLLTVWTPEEVILRFLKVVF